VCFVVPAHSSASNGSAPLLNTLIQMWARAGAMPVIVLLFALAGAQYCAAAPDLSGDIVTSEYLLLSRPPAAALFDCDAWDDSLHVTLQLMSATLQHSNRAQAAQLCPGFLTCLPPPPLPPALPPSTCIRNAAHEEGGSGYRCNVEVDGAVVRMCDVGGVECDVGGVECDVGGVECDE
jgi:hypothetical protein